MYHEALLKRLKALIIFRAALITVLLGTFSLFSIGYGKLPYPQAIIYLLVAAYPLSIVYAFLLRRIANPEPLAYFQLSMDAVFEIALIFMTGGIESWFPSIMLLTVIASAFILNKKAGYIIATLCSILFGLMLDLQFYGILPIGYDPALKEKDFLYNIFTHIFALYLTAYLTGHLSSRLEKAAKSLEEKDSDLKDLALFNRELIEALPSGLLTTDLGGRVMVFNRAAENITGMRKTEAVGRHIVEIFPFLVYPFDRERKEGAIDQGGRDVTVGLNLSETFESGGSMTGHICIFQDITEIKKLESEVKRKETLAAIGELSANMAHEIRNPLASLKSSIEMLKEGRLTKERSDKLMNIAINEMDRLNKIITDFLSYSRPRPLEFSWFDLQEVLDDTVELLRHSLTGSDATAIRKEFSGRDEIFADSDKLRQIFLNLGMNAVEAMPGGGELTVATRREGEKVAVSFRDTGIGIQPEHRREVFYPFFTTKDRGTGLGLSIAHRIIEEHGGSIVFTSTPGQGTTFEVLIPVVPPRALSITKR